MSKDTNLQQHISLDPDMSEAKFILAEKTQKKKNNLLAINKHLEQAQFIPHNTHTHTALSPSGL